jgi:hypothetical protein
MNDYRDAYSTNWHNEQLLFRILLRCQRNNETLNVVEGRRRMDIFNEEYIEFCDSPKLFRKLTVPNSSDYH